MRNTVWLALALSGSGFAQSNNAAETSLRKRLDALKLIPNLNSSDAAAKTCSIPLLNAVPPGFQSKMPIVVPPAKPSETSREPKLRVPAPPCDSKLFQNK